MNSAVVAFTDPQGVFKKFEERLEENVKVLTNLHWRPTRSGPAESRAPGALSGPGTGAPASTGSETPIVGMELGSSAVRTIPFLELKLAPEMGHHQRQHQIPGLSNVPLVQILVFETAPLDIYRSKLRQIGREWFKNQVQVRDSTGYIVVHSVLPEDSPKQVKAMWTRITNEFDLDHCIQLNPDVSSDWARLRNLVKEQLLWAFNARIEMLDAEIRKLEATRDVPGWNFGVMFAVHESLAWAYESMNLLDDGLRVYELLEKMLAQHEFPKKYDSPFTTSFIGPHTALIEPMLAQTASHFDAHRHIVSRQVDLLLAMAMAKKHHEDQVDSLADQLVFSGLRLFLDRLPMLLSSLNALIGRESAYRWLLSVSRELLARIGETGSPKLMSGKGDLLLVERDALQALGLVQGFSIPGVFNDIQLDDGDEINGLKNEKTVTDTKGTADSAVPELASEEAFQEEFVRLTKQAIEYFRVTHAQRTVVRLTGQLVLITYYQEDYEATWNLLESNPRLLRLAPQRKPETAMLGIALDCVKRLEKLSEMLELSWQILGLMAYQVLPQDLARTATETINKLGDFKPLEHSASLWFDPRMDPYLRGDAEGYYLELSLVNLHPSYPFIALEEASLTATVESEHGPARREVIFQAANLGAEYKTVRLYTRHFIQGTLRLDRLELRFKKQTLIHDFSDKQVAMRPLATAFHGQITLAKNYSMRKRNIILKLTSPKTVERAKVKFQAIDMHLQLLLDRIEGLKSLSDFTSAEVSVPALLDHANPVGQLWVVIEHDDCIYEFKETVNFQLIISVGFEEYFRPPPKVFTQFLVEPSSPTPIIFSGAELTGSRLYDVTDFASEHRCKEFVAFQNSPVSYLFSLVKRDEPLKKMSTEMRLSLTYRSLLWECQHILYDTCVSALKNKGLNCYTPAVSNVTQQLSKHIDIERYLTTGFIDVPMTYVAQYVAFEFELMDPEDARKVTTAIEESLENGANNEKQDFSNLNATMELEVPNPDATLIHYVDLVVDPGTKQCVVGDTIPVTLQIETMAVQESDLKGRRFAYELDRSSEGWSYTGKAKGIFTGSDTVIEQLNLVPNRSGELLLPGVIIRPLTEGEEIDDDADDSVEVLPAEEDTEIVLKHANSRILVIPETNMLAITF